MAGGEQRQKLCFGGLLWPSDNKHSRVLRLKLKIYASREKDSNRIKVWRVALFNSDRREETSHLLSDHCLDPPRRGMSPVAEASLHPFIPTDAAVCIDSTDSALVGIEIRPTHLRQPSLSVPYKHSLLNSTRSGLSLSISSKQS